MAEQTLQQEKLEFKTELKQLLHIITHSLYSNREIFLRELISNAADAINRIKFDSLDQEEKLEGDKDWKIRIIPDAEKGTLTVADNGIGMSREGIIDQLGTIAKSGTRALLEQLKQQEAAQRPDLIGQFGVGFYSAFMVADKVVVRSRLAGEPADQGVEWESDGQGEFTVESITKEKRGTEVILHLKEDAKDFLQEWTLRGLVKKYSDFLEHPVVMDVTREEGEGDEKTTKTVEETLNTRDAIWLRSPSEIKKEEYEEFYKSISHDFQAPARTIHYTAEGLQEFKVLCFVPSHRPMDLMYGEPKAGLRLYIQRVLIMDQCEELLPSYLRFVKGVVDSSDLPLNISRELLQQNPMLARMQKDIVRSVLKDLKSFREDDCDSYVSFFGELGGILKEGIGQDFGNRERVAELLLVQSMKTDLDKHITLDQYIEAMPEGQEDIYYLIGETRGLIESSPHLEAFRERGQDVLLLTDPIDELWTSHLAEYKGKKLKAADREAPKDDEAKPSDEEQESFKGLIETLKNKIPEVNDVRLTKRLKSSACCLVAPEGGMTAHMERLMEKLGQGAGMASQRILELNPDHETVKALRDLHAKSAEDARIESYGRLLYDQAVLAEGSKLESPAALAERINELILRDVKGE